MCVGLSVTKYVDESSFSLSLSTRKPCEGLSSLSRVEKNRLLDTRVGVPRMNFDDPYINGGEGRDKTDWIGLPSFSAVEFHADWQSNPFERELNWKTHDRTV